MTDFSKRVVVITGATGGLGSVVAGHFAAAGASLALFARNLTKLEELASFCAKINNRVIFRALDLTTAEAAEEAKDFVLENYTKVDILIHLLGGWAGGKPVAEIPQQEMSDMLQQHLWSTFYLAKAFVPHFIANGWGRIIVVSSPRANRPPAKGASYAVGKAAQEALMLALSQELKDSGVTANIIQVNTIDVAHEKEKEKTAKNASWTTPEEIVALMDYFCTEEASIVNGARVPMYGSY